MTYAQNFRIQTLPYTTNQLFQMGPWQRKKHREEVHQFVAAAVTGKKPMRPLKHARLTLIRHSSVEPDQDGNTGSFKYVIDGLRYCGVIEDDKPSNIKVEYGWMKAPPKKGWVFVRVEEVESACITAVPTEGGPHGLNHSEQQ